MILMFVRHGDAKNDKLTHLGKSQCEIAVKQNDKFEFSKIYSSPAGRCIQTASYFAKKYKLDLETVENLREREMLENGEPQTKEEQEWYDNYMNPNYSSKNPEGCKEYLERLFFEFKRIVNENVEQNRNVIVVAHSGTLYALNAFICGVEKDKKINWIRLGNCSKIYFEFYKKID